MAQQMSRVAEVKAKVSIPMYFYNLIVPQRSDYYSDYTVDFDLKAVVKCPLHDEDTPSMRYYEETNTFYCFGCRAGGDVIELHRRVVEKIDGFKPSFKDSVDFLYDFFIKENESAKVTNKAHGLSSNEVTSSNLELIQYNRFTDGLERGILADILLDSQKKLGLWRALDDMDVLVSKREVNAMDAIDYIKGKVGVNV